MKVIKISDRAYKKLDEFKVHPSQPFWEVVNNVLKISDINKQRRSKNEGETK